MNTGSISGRLTADPEMHTFASGTTKTSFSIAHNKRVKRDEEWQDEVHFFDCAYWGRRGELMAEKAEKGDEVFCTYEIAQERWEATDGTKRSKVVLKCSEVLGEFVYRKAGEARGASQAELPAEPAQAGTGKGDDDDIPF